MKNAMGDMLGTSGPKPGERWPNMGKSPFSTPSTKPPMPQDTSAPAQPKPQERPDVGKPPPVFKSSRAPAFDTGAAQQARGVTGKGMVQRDGTQNPPPKQAPPQKNAPLQARGPISKGAPMSGIERAMGAHADKLHPVKPRGKGK